MSFDLQRVLASKRMYRQKLAVRPVAENTLSSMAISTFDRLFRPVLELSAQGPITRSTTTEAMVQQHGLTPEEVANKLPSGNATTIGNRTGSTRAAPTKAGLKAKVAPKTDRAAELGRAFLQQHQGKSILCLLFFLLLPSLAAQSGWMVGRTNLPGISLAESIAFGNGRFVVTLGDSPTAGVAWSTDGLTWRPSGTPMFLRGTVLFTGGAFYYAGQTGVWHSTDGDRWQQIYFPRPFTMFRGMAGNGRSLMIVAPYTGDKFLLYTADFVTWHQAAPLPNETEGVSALYGDLVYALGRYYLSHTLLGSAGGLPGFTPQVAWTVDGSEWTLATAPLISVRSLAAGNNRLVASLAGLTSTIATSTDGITFTMTPIPSGITNSATLLFAGGRFFFTDTLQASLDAQTWAPLAPVSLPANGQVRSMAYGNGRYVAVGSAQGADLIASLPVAAPPLVAASPADRTVAEGARVTLTVTLENPGATTTYQWRRNSVAIAGATAASLELNAVRLADAGIYTVDIRNDVGATASEPMQLTILPASAGGRIVNVSVLTSIDAASEAESSFTVGFVVGGAGTQGSTSLLVRAGGPSLARFGVATPNVDPRLEVFNGSQMIAENDNWGGSGSLAEVANRVGAFAFDGPDSKDAAVFDDKIAAGDKSVRILGMGGATGTVLAEVYDATPASAFTAATPRLINVSVLKSLRSGASLSAGFVIGGATSRSVVIRVIGPSLAGFGVTAPVSDPRAAVFRGGASAAFVSNDAWGGTNELAEAFRAVGAFPLAPGSRDAALLLSLEAGEYVVQASNPGASSGTALIEIYEVP